MAIGKVSVAAGAGAASGFIAGPMFQSIGMASFLQDHYHRPAFVVGITAMFCLLALILSSLISSPNEARRESVVLFRYGTLILGLICLICVMTVVKNDVLNPSIDIAAHFQPDLSEFKDPDKKDSVKLSLTYNDPEAAEKNGQKIFDIRSGIRQTLKSNDTLYLNYSGLDHLASKYTSLVEKNGELGRQLEIACQHATKDVCALLHPTMEDFASGHRGDL